MRIEQLKYLRYRKEGPNTLIFNIRNFKLYKYEGHFLFYLFEEIKNKKYLSLEEASRKISYKFNLDQVLVSQKIQKLFSILKLILNDEHNGFQSLKLLDFKNSSSIQLSVPLYITLYPTYSCNLHCQHCLCGNLGRNSRFSDKNEMTIGDINKIAEEMAFEKIFVVILTGGEPTVREDFFQILETFYNKELGICISTNGTLFTENFTKKIVEYEIMSFNISLDGASSETCDFIRGKGVYKKIIRGLTNLIKHGYRDRILIKLVYFKYNLNEIESFIILLKNLGIRSVCFVSLKPWGRGEKVKELCPSINEIVAVNKEIMELKSKYPELHIYGDAKVGESCTIPFSMAILPNGETIPCELFEQRLNSQILIGNIKSKTLKEIWNSEKTKQIRRKSIEFFKNVRELTGCSQCKIFNYCYTNRCIGYTYVNFKKLEVVRSGCKNREHENFIF